ncbi:MAG: hypothetical protein Q7P63_15465 [Verrucomicrobiota bacterium JB022]|nr:hypothetical protein [Verrucomicrobiota bacterium JB022]
MTLSNAQGGVATRLWLFGLLAGLLSFGFALGLSASDGLFLSQLGADKLPLIYLLTPFLMAGYISLFSWIQVRVSIEGTMKIVGGILVVGGCLGALAIWLESRGVIGEWLYYVLKLYVAVWWIGLYTLIWNFVEAYFEVSEGKRHFGVIAAASAGGTILGGATASFFAGQLPVWGFFLGWAVAGAATWPVIRQIERRCQNLDALREEDREDEPSLVAVLRETFANLRRSPYALWVALLYFSLPLLNTLSEYLAYEQLESLATESGLVSLFGRLYAIAFGVNLVISLFLFRPLVQRFGTRGLVLVQPAAYFFVFVWFSVDYGLPVAFAGFYAYQTLLVSIDNNNANILFAALPLRSKRQIRTFIEGLGEPVAIAVVGAVLFFWGELSLHVWIYTGLGLTLWLFFVATRVRGLYQSGVAANLRASQLDFSAVVGQGQQKLGVADPVALAGGAMPVKLDEEALRPLARRFLAGNTSAAEEQTLLANTMPGMRTLALEVAHHFAHFTLRRRTVGLEVIRRAEEPGALPVLFRQTRYLPRETDLQVRTLAREMGTVATPILLAAYRDIAQPRPVRSAALHALEETAFSQIEQAWPEVVDGALARSTAGLAFARSFLPGDAWPEQLLRRAAVENWRRATEWSLENLAAVGLTPPYAALYHGLNAEDSKTRADAFESVLEGLDRQTANRLKPLLEAYLQPDRSTQQEPVPTPPLQELVASNNDPQLVRWARLVLHQRGEATLLPEEVAQDAADLHAVDGTHPPSTGRILVALLRTPIWQALTLDELTFARSLATWNASNEDSTALTVNVRAGWTLQWSPEAMRALAEIFPAFALACTRERSLP